MNTKRQERFERLIDFLLFIHFIVLVVQHLMYDILEEYQHDEAGEKGHKIPQFLLEKEKKSVMVAVSASAPPVHNNISKFPWLLKRLDPGILLFFLLFM